MAAACGDALLTVDPVTGRLQWHISRQDLITGAQLLGGTLLVVLFAAWALHHLRAEVTFWYPDGGGPGDLEDAEYVPLADVIPLSPRLERVA
jgi:hypothetical protein